MAYLGVSPSNGVRQTYDYTATAGQTSFSGSDNNSRTLRYTDSAYIDVYQNGILLVPSDYTATTGTTVVLDTGATVSDTLQIVVYDVFSVADTVSASDGGTFTGAVTFSGGVVGAGFPSGTSMLFQQTAAPTGWTKSTTHNDKALRLTSGTVGTGGSVAFSTAMATPAVAGGSVSGDPGSNLAVAAGNLAVSMSGNVSNTTLSTSQIPSHSHQSRMFTPGNQGVMAYNYYFPAAAFASTQPNYAAGSGGSHNHGHNISGSMTGAPSLSGNVTSGNLAVGASTATINLQYVDFIIANKD
jgi:hypothetical protein